MNQEYIPILILLGVVLLNAIGLPLASHLLGPQRPTAVKGTPYESGMPPLGNARERFSVKFYLVAMLFILFDIEVVFLYPWAVVYREMLAQNAGLIFGSMISFLGILFVGYIYALKKKALEWKY